MFISMIMFIHLFVMNKDLYNKFIVDKRYIRYLRNMFNIWEMFNIREMFNLADWSPYITIGTH